MSSFSFLPALKPACLASYSLFFLLLLLPSYPLNVQKSLQEKKNYKLLYVSLGFVMPKWNPGTHTHMYTHMHMHNNTHTHTYKYPPLTTSPALMPIFDSVWELFISLKLFRSRKLFKSRKQWISFPGNTLRFKRTFVSK